MKANSTPENSDKPPLFNSWEGWYILQVVVLVVIIGLLWWGSN
jgi:hypothetical protein